MAERKLLDQVSDLARLKHLSLRTEEAYRNWIKRFIFFHGKRHPRELDAAAVRAFLTYLAVDEHVSASTQNQAFSALLFLYKQVLQIESLDIAGVPRARPSRRVPVVFTQNESRAIISQMTFVLFSLIPATSALLSAHLRKSNVWIREIR